jgi:flavin reductase (DIM6/NTAB) family NADH-FMN oxidoreductase RutF
MQKQVEYSEAVKTKYPEQVVITIAKDRQGKANPVTLGWTMIVSGNPPMMALVMFYDSVSISGNG